MKSTVLVERINAYEFTLANQLTETKLQKLNDLLFIMHLYSNLTDFNLNSDELIMKNSPTFLFCLQNPPLYTSSLHAHIRPHRRRLRVSTE